MSEISETVIIVAGGSGSRMQSALPKHFILLAGQPILMHTIRQFSAFNPALETVALFPTSVSIASLLYFNKSKNYKNDYQQSYEICR